MNIEELKGAWNNQEGDQELTDFETTTLKKSHQPIDVIRKKMKHEFRFQLMAILFIGVFPFLFGIRGEMLVLFYINYVIMLIITAYYFARFHKLFKTMHHYEVTLKEGLMHLYFEIRLHLEMYKSFNFLLVPFVLFMFGITRYGKNQASKTMAIQAYEPDYLIKYSVFSLIVILLMLFFTNLWINRYYGKHVSKIKELLDDLTGED